MRVTVLGRLRTSGLEGGIIFLIIKLLIKIITSALKKKTKVFSE